MKIIKSTLRKINELTLERKVLLALSAILPAGSLILIFSRLGRQITRKLTKEKTLKTFGKIEVTNEDIYRDLYNR